MSRVLVIDDEEQVRSMFREAFEDAGYEVDVASNGEEGIGLLCEKPADLIVTDIIMPEKEGLETIIELRRRFPDVRIIAISGGGIVSPGNYLRLAEALGAARVFAKPVSLGELVDSARELVGTED